MTRDKAAEIVGCLFEESYQGLTRFAYRRTGDLERAEELVHDVLMSLFAELRRGKTIQHPKAWSLVVLQRKIQQERRKIYAAPYQSFEDVESLEADRWADLYSPAASDDVSRLMAHLTEREREVMLLRMESLKYREIAMVLGISKNTVNALLARGLVKLRALVLGKPVNKAFPERHAEKRKSAATTL
jgi:RNA polymerase sigma factor (sigma-70 family)